MITFSRLASAFILITSHGFAQSVLDTPVSDVRSQSLHEFLQEVESRYRVKAFYLDEWFAGYDIDSRFEGHTIRKILDAVLQGSSITYDFLYDYALIFSKDPAMAIQRESLLSRAVIQRQAIERIVIGSRSQYKPGVPVVLTGKLRDQDTGDALEGATVIVNDKVAASTASTGVFLLSLLPGDHILSISKSQYDGKVLDLSIYEKGTLEIKLQETPIVLDEVLIADDMLLDRTIGKTSLNISQVKRVPLFLGESDIIKQVQAQPGVTTTGEMASGFNVRGGSVDQNLVLYDGVPIFNTAHALGFFSAFNPEAVSDASFYRGGIPAEYGGRVSSVLDVRSREGDFKGWTGGGGIGLISSHLLIGGPIKKDTTSAILSLRSTYSNWMLHAVNSNYEDIENTAVNFYDASLKLTHRFSERSKLTLSGYRSGDQFSLKDDTTFYWSNGAAALRYDRSLTERLMASVSLTFGRYSYKIEERDPSTAFNLEYSVTYPALKIHFQKDGIHNLAFGVENTWYAFKPGRLRALSETSNVRAIEMKQEPSLETALYFSDRYAVSPNLFVEAGIRVIAFNRFGPETVYRYKPDAPREVHNIVDSVVYQKGEISKSYLAVEPRVSLRYAINDNTSVKLGFDRMLQFIHLITNTAALTPTDIWQSSNAYFQPQKANQVSAGLFRTSSDHKYESLVEVYYKEVQNTLDYKDGANLILNPNLETALIPTLATSYGAEISISKTQGRLQGSFNYTYSRSFRQSETRFDAEQINRGERYPANHDQPHVANIHWRYAISRRIFFSGNFVYHTGRPVSMPSSLYVINGVPISDFTTRNQFRIPDYHRADVAFIFEGNHKRNKLWTGHWIFSFYNVYARKNAYSVFFADDGSGYLRPYKLSVIGSVIPAISYSFKF